MSVTNEALIDPAEDDFQPDDKGCCPSRACHRCCEYYAHAVRTGVCRKKYLSNNPTILLKSELKRCLNTWDLTAYGLANMLGGSIYVLTGAVILKKTGPSIFLAYFLAGMVALLNAINYSELACRIPKAGSAYSYSYILLGEFVAFLTGWSVLLEYIIGSAVITRGFSSILDVLTGSRISGWLIQHLGRLAEPHQILAEYLDIVGFTLIVIMSVISCFGVRSSARVTAFFIVTNMTVLATTSIYMFVYAKGINIDPPLPVNISLIEPITSSSTFIPYNLAGLVGGTAICFNAFIGFDAISTCAEEAAQPAKSVPRANAIAVLSITFLTTFSSLALILYMPWYLIKMEGPFHEALRDNIFNGGPELARTVLLYIVGVGSLLGLSSSLLSSLVAGTRVMYAIAQDGLLYSPCSKVCQPFQTPVIATLFIATVTALLDLIFSIESLADFVSLGTLMAYTVASFGIIALRYGPQPERSSYREPENAQVVEEKIAEQADHLGPDPIDRIGQPGYLKTSWASCMSPGLKTLLNRGPPGRVSLILMIIYALFNICLVISLKVGAPHTDWPVWRIICTVLFLALMIGCIALISAYRQFASPRLNLFRLPMVPLTPCATLSINVFLISELTWVTWVRFGIWLVIGIFSYFVYGVTHSTAAAEEEERQFLNPAPSIPDVHYLNNIPAEEKTA